MSFLGIAFEMSAIDAGMEDGVNSAIGALDGINESLEKQIKKIKGVKAQDIFGAMKNGAKAAAKGFEEYTKSFGIVQYQNDKGMGKMAKTWSRTIDDIDAELDALVFFAKRGFQSARESFDKFKASVHKGGAKVKAGFDKIKNATKNVGGWIVDMKDKFNSVIGGMQNRVAQFNVANIASNVKALTGETGNLSNSLESTFVGMVKTTKPIAATMDLTSAQIKKLSGRAASLAYSMNVSEDMVMQMFKATETASDGTKAALDAMGMSEKDWIKVLEGSGKQMEDFTSILGTMTDQMGLSGEESAKTMDEVLSLSKQAGVGLAPIEGLKDHLSDLQTSMEKLPPSLRWTNDEMMQSMKSSVRLAGAFKKMGKSEAEATSMANAMNKSFVDQAIEMENALEIGNEMALGEIPLFRELTRVTGDTGKAMEIMRVAATDSSKGMDMISQAMDGANDGSVQGQRLISDLKKVLGEVAPGAGEMAMRTSEMGTALSEVNNMAPKAGQTLKQFGKEAYSSGLTLQDTYDRAREAFDTTFRSISRKGVRGTVREQIKGMRDAGKELKEMGKEDGAMGTVVRMASKFDQMGIGGIFAEIAEGTGSSARDAAKMGAMYGKVFDTVSKVGDEVAPLMQVFGTLGVGGLLATGVGAMALFGMDDETRKEILGDYEYLFDDAKKEIDKFFGGKSFGELIDEWKPRVKKFVKSMGDTLKGMFKTLIDSGVMKDIGKGLLGAAKWFTDNVDFKAVGDLMGDAVTMLIPKIVQLLKSIWAKIGEEFGVGGQIGIAVLGLAKVFGPSLVGSIAEGLAGGGAGSVALKFGKLLVGFLSSPVGMVVAAAAFGVAVGSLIWNAIESNALKKGKEQQELDKKERSRQGEWVMKSAGKRSGAFVGLDMEGAADGDDYGSLQRIALGMREGQIKTSDYREKQNRLEDFYGARAVGQKGVSIDSVMKKTWVKMEERLEGLAAEKGAKYMSLPFDEMKDALSRVQQLPEFQDRMDRIVAAQKKNAEEWGRGGSVSDKNEAYEKSMEAMAEHMRGLALWASSAEAGKAVGQYETEQAAVGRVTYMQKHGEYFTGSELDQVKEDAMAGGWELGKSLGTGFGNSMAPGGEGAKEMEKGLEDAKKNLGGSLPETGPLANGIAAYWGGYETMLSFADGLVDSTDVVRAAMEQTLNDSVIASMEMYATKMGEIAEQKTFLEDVAKSMVRSMGGTIETSIDVSGEQENVKKTLEAALSIPGLAGVTTAIVNEGAQTRKVLGRILDEMKSQRPNGGTGARPPETQ